MWSPDTARHARDSEKGTEGGGLRGLILVLGLVDTSQAAAVMPHTSFFDIPQLPVP